MRVYAGEILGPDCTGVPGVVPLPEERKLAERALALQRKYLAPSLEYLMMAEVEYNAAAEKLTFKLRPAKICAKGSGASSYCCVLLLLVLRLSHLLMSWACRKHCILSADVCVGMLPYTPACFGRHHPAMRL